MIVEIGVKTKRAATKSLRLPVKRTFCCSHCLFYANPDKHRNMWGIVCKFKNFVPSTCKVIIDHIPSEEKLMNFVYSRINILSFGSHISTFYPAQTVTIWICASFDCRTRNCRPYIVSSARTIVSKLYFCVQIWLVSEECFVVKLAKVSYLVSHYNTVRAKKFKICSNLVFTL